MTATKVQRSVLVIGKSCPVLRDAVAAFRALGFTADATNEFADVSGRFDMSAIDAVVLGGQVPPDRKAELRVEIAAINPRVVFVDGLAGIPGLIVSQVEGALNADSWDASEAPAYVPETRSIRLALGHPADVRATAWWQTSFAPPDPQSASLLLLARQLGGGDHVVRIPDLVPSTAAFASVQIDAAVYAFSIATE